MAGYSKTPLAQKLGYKPGLRVRLVGAPASYLDELDAALSAATVLRATRAPVDLAHLFAPTRRELERSVPPLARALSPAGSLWISWTKKASGIPTDVTEALVRDAGLGAGLVDVKVCAVDDRWSALRFMRRIGERGA